MEEIPLDVGPRHFSLDVSALVSAPAAEGGSADPLAAAVTDATPLAGDAPAAAAAAAAVPITLRDLRPGDKLRCTLPEAPKGAAPGELPPALKALQDRGERAPLSHSPAADLLALTDNAAPNAC